MDFTNNLRKYGASGGGASKTYGKKSNLARAGWLGRGSLWASEFVNTGKGESGSEEEEGEKEAEVVVEKKKKERKEKERKEKKDKKERKEMREKEEKEKGAEVKVEIEALQEEHEIGGDVLEITSDVPLSKSKVPLVSQAPPPAVVVVKIPEEIPETPYPPQRRISTTIIHPADPSTPTKNSTTITGRSKRGIAPDEIPPTPEVGKETPKPITITSFDTLSPVVAAAATFELASPERRGSLRRKSSRLSRGMPSPGRSREGTPGPSRRSSPPPPPPPLMVYSRKEVEVESAAGVEGASEERRVGRRLPLTEIQNECQVRDDTPPKSSTETEAITKPIPKAELEPGSEIKPALKEVEAAAEEEATPLAQLLRLCTITHPVDFTTQITTMLASSEITKLGEASYSEVFLQTPTQTTSTHPSSLAAPPSSVIKIIPFHKPAQCTAQQILEEVRITKSMGSIPGFIGFHGCYVVQGPFPPALIERWDYYDYEIKESENERPDFYEDDQLFAVIVLENGGVDLENFELAGWREAREVFWQVACALARGEREREFEHRDLHFGNIVITRLDSSSSSSSSSEDPPEDLLDKLTLNDHPSKSPTLKVSLIDYTLSRALCPGPTPSSEKTLSVAPLDDDALFEGKGEYQFDIYRFMRKLFTANTANTEVIDWTPYRPKTNIYWLHYLTYILLSRKDLKRPSSSRSRRGKSGAAGAGAAAAAASEGERAAYAEIERVGKLIDCRRRRFVNGDGGALGVKNEFGSVEELVEWAVGEGLVGMEELEVCRV